MNNVYVYILVMAVVTYLIRMLPLTLAKKEITSPFIKILFVLRAICLSGSHDLPGHSLGDRERVLRGSRLSGGAFGVLQGKESGDGGASGLRGRVCGGADTGVL